MSPFSTCTDLCVAIRHVILTKELLVMPLLTTFLSKNYKYKLSPVKVNRALSVSQYANYLAVSTLTTKSVFVFLISSYIMNPRPKDK